MTRPEPWAPAQSKPRRSPGRRPVPSPEAAFEQPERRPVPPGPLRVPGCANACTPRETHQGRRGECRESPPELDRRRTCSWPAVHKSHWTRMIGKRRFSRGQGALGLRGHAQRSPRVDCHGIGSVLPGFRKFQKLSIVVRFGINHPKVVSRRAAEDAEINHRRTILYSMLPFVKIAPTRCPCALARNRTTYNL